MPWRVTSPMYEPQRFVLDADHTTATFAELCRRSGGSRKPVCPTRARGHLRSLASARGTRRGAHAGTVTELWIHTDPELQPLVAEAREALVRLGKQSS